MAFRAHSGVYYSVYTRVSGHTIAIWGLVALYGTVLHAVKLFKGISDFHPLGTCNFAVNADYVSHFPLKARVACS